MSEIRRENHGEREEVTLTVDVFRLPQADECAQAEPAAVSFWKAEGGNTLAIFAGGYEYYFKPETLIEVLEFLKKYE